MMTLYRFAALGCVLATMAATSAEGSPAEAAAASVARPIVVAADAAEPPEAEMPGRTADKTPDLASAVGRNNTAVVLDHVGGRKRTPALRITFGRAEWPNASWSAGEGGAWDWRGSAILALDVTNPGKTPVTFGVRVDDDPVADGVTHSQTGTGTIAAGETATFFIDLERDDPMTTYGMRGGPPAPGRAGMSALSGGGVADAGHVVGFQIFLHHPNTPTDLLVSNFRLLPSAKDPARYDGIVDVFGQYAKAEWPGKVHSAAEMKKRHAEERRAMERAKRNADLDEYGGWKAGPQLPAPGFFATAKRDGNWWLVTPSGHLFLSFGVDSISPWAPTLIGERERMFADLPKPDDPLARHYGQVGHVLYGPIKSGKTFDFATANLERVFGPGYEGEWGDEALARLKYWGFNTIGNWSHDGLRAAHQLPYVATLSVGGDHARVSSGSDYWGKMHDPFDPKFETDAILAIRDEALRRRSDPWLIGYFVDNELSWGGRAGPDGGRYGLAYGALAADEKSPAKRAFIAQLKEKYETIEKFNTAWATSLASWDALLPPFKLAGTPRNVVRDDMGAFVLAFARRYFTVVRDTVKKFDANHLYLGCRFAWRTTEAVQAAGEVCDIVSFNIYEQSLDPKAWAFVADLNKPCLIGEFHFGALDRGMFHPGLVAAPSQAARAKMYETFVRSVVDNPSFVGAHWFQYADEPLTGRTLDGENYNIGFVTVADTPYPEMVAAARRVHAEVYTRRAAAK